MGHHCTGRIGPAEGGLGWATYTGMSYLSSLTCLGANAYNMCFNWGQMMAEFLHCTSHSEGSGNMILIDAHHTGVRYLTYGGTVVLNVHIMVLLRCVL